MSAIAANKIKGARAVYVTNPKEAELTRLHNAANVICLSESLSYDIRDVFTGKVFTVNNAIPIRPEIKYLKKENLHLKMVLYFITQDMNMLVYPLQLVRQKQLVVYLNLYTKLNYF